MFSFQSFQQSKVMLAGFVDNYYWLSVFTYIFVYTTFVIFAVPSPTVLTIIGGFLFNFIPALIIVLIASTLGAVGAFLFAQYIAGEMLQKRYSNRLNRFNTNFKQHGIWYLLSVRFIPFFPFSLISFLAGLTKIDLFTFTWTTAVGIFPATALLVYGGHHLEHINSIKEFFAPEIILGLTLLSILGLIPFLFKK